MRLDNFLVDNGFFDSRTKAQQAINRGEIFINGECVKKCSLSSDNLLKEDIEYRFESKFVSLGGYKLDKALTDFNFSVSELVVADVGASTGGFTDCLLQRGSKKVFAVDLNDSLLHDKIKRDNRVKTVIKNARELKLCDFDSELDLIVADLSFISVTYVLETFSNLLQKNKHLIILIKPQFETFKKIKFKHGIVRDQKIQKEICDNVIKTSESYGFSLINFTTAPIVKDKNVEFLILLKKNS
ncbi:MAG: TlyA family RNA methyltransferase [Clostridia bacterium]|nr:TlyA family RNA methyltransferase [Clostridia bacterium]